MLYCCTTAFKRYHDIAQWHRKHGAKQSKNKDQRVLLRLFFEVHKHLLVILNLLKVRESWVVWNVFQFVATGDWSTSSQKLIAGIWEDMLVKGFMSDIHLQERYLFLWEFPTLFGRYTTSSTQGKAGRFYAS